MALTVTLRLQGTVAGEQVSLASIWTVPDTLTAAKQRISKMLATRYDGLAQKPEVVDGTGSNEIQVSFEGTPVIDTCELFAQMQAAAHNTTTVTN